MTSTLRIVRQPVSNYFWSHDADLFTLDRIQAAFRGESGSTYPGPEPEYVGNLILFDTEAHFLYATYQLFGSGNVSSSYHADGFTVHIDMGNTLYIGVKGAESRMLIMSLVKTQGTAHVGYGLSGMNVNEYVYTSYNGDVEIDLVRAAV